MARKTAPEIEQDLYDLAAEFFAGKVSGQVFMSDTRPADSAAEDVVVCQPYTTPGQFNQGNARLLCFIPDFDNGSGHLVPDKARLIEVAGWHDQLLDYLNQSQRTYIFDTFGEIAPVGKYPSAKEHFIDFHFSFTHENF